MGYYVIDTFGRVDLGYQARPATPMNSADVEYLWRISKMFEQPLRIFMEVENIAIDDRIPPKGLKE